MAAPVAKHRVEAYISPVVPRRFDFVLIGGGLQNGLLALALLHHCRGARIALVEREAALGGNHTWCFHAGDVPVAAQSWVEPLVVKRWASHEVTFPDLSRVLKQPYAVITSARFHQVVSTRLSRADGCMLVCGAFAEKLTADKVTLADGRVLEGWLVDARGPYSGVEVESAGFQKFLGLEVELKASASIAHPVVMDARVDQHDGYRFVYVLPFSGRRMLIEDTYFSDDPNFDPDLLRERVHEYLRHRGWVLGRVLREESGVLPMPWSGPVPAELSIPFAGGYRGGWFHPGTGYSLPAAVRVAQVISEYAPDPPTRKPLMALRTHHAKQARFARFLNWMLFRAAKPSQRWRILERFYRLPEDTIARFYALELNGLDRARIMVGRPPRGLRIPWPDRRGR